MNLPILVAALSTSLILLAAGAEHVVAQGKLRSSLRVHGLFGPRGIGPVVIALPALELITAAGALGSVAVANQNWLVASLTLQTVLFGSFAGYLAMVMRAGKAGVPCACGLAEVPVGRAAVARAGGLALLSAVCALGATTAAAPLTLPQGADALVTGLAAVTFAVLLVILASARRVEPSTTDQQAGQQEVGSA